jgi:hypothetical protein
MSFVVENEVTVIGMFSQNGFQTIRVGTPVDIVFDNAPGRIYHAKITAIPKGVGQGQIAVSGTLARTNALGGASGSGGHVGILDTMSNGSRACELLSPASVVRSRFGKHRPSAASCRLFPGDREREHDRRPCDSYRGRRRFVSDGDFTTAERFRL